MDKAKFINSLSKSKLIAHRLGYKMTDYPENTINSIEAIFKNKKLLDACDGFEFDICFTKDHVPVVIHDKYVDDITSNEGAIKEYTFDELRKMNFGYKKSINKKYAGKYTILSLDELLTFFSKQKELLKDKVIKIETKDPCNINRYNLIILADMLNKYPSLSKNVVHLSYYPQNIIALKKVQAKRKYYKTKSDLLCENCLMVNMSRLTNSIDGISLRIKTTDLPKVSKNNTRRVNKKIRSDRFFMTFSNALSEKIIQYAISKYGYVSFYLLNTDDEINKFSKKVSEKLFAECHDSFVFTTDNPYELKNNRHFSK